VNGLQLLEVIGAGLVTYATAIGWAWMGGNR